jgi:integration host factor subunit beta
MTKADLVDEVVRVAHVSKKHAEIIVNTVFSSIIEALKGEDKIELRGFGSFRVRRRRPRQGRNPKTGAQVAVPEKRIPYFKPGKELKDLINEDGPSSNVDASPLTKSTPSGSPGDRLDDPAGDS